MNSLEDTNHFQKIPQMIRLGQQLQPIKPLITGIGMGMERWGSSTQVRRFGDFLQQVPNPGNAYRSFRGIFFTLGSLSNSQVLLSRADFISKYSCRKYQPVFF